MNHAHAVACAAALALTASAAEPLQRIQTIPLPDVSGRIDHFALDLAAQRLFVAALGNDTVEVLDLRAGKRTTTLRDLPGVQGIAYAPDLDKLFCALDADGTCRIFSGPNLTPAGRADFKDDADNVRYEPRTHTILVGYGSGGIGILDARTGTNQGHIPLPGHPESFQIETNGTRIFVNVPDARKVLALDREQKRVLAEWPLHDARANFPMAFDETTSRLYIGCRSPALLLVLDTATGRETARVPIHGDTDDIFIDHARHRIYVSCGEGWLDTLQLDTPDKLTRIAELKTVSGARTAYYTPALNRLYLAVPKRIGQPCEIRVYEPR